jgi:hypothetical protein
MKRCIILIEQKALSAFVERAVIHQAKSGVSQNKLKMKFSLFKRQGANCALISPPSVLYLHTHDGVHAAPKKCRIVLCDIQSQ